MSISRMHTTERASKIVIHNGVIYLAGQVAEDADSDIQEQTRSTLARIDAVLAEAGSDREHLLSAVVYLRDIDNDFAPMNEVWNAWLPNGHAPARACVEAHMARSALLVEISVVAAVVN
jgi:enamine deaminase RidA (YjgF/YER057c/UK114 family)